MLKEGIVYVFKTPVLRNFYIICITLNCMLIPLSALKAPIVNDIFGMGSELLSFAGIFASIGGIVGAVLLPYIAKIDAERISETIKSRMDPVPDCFAQDGTD